jgi:ceramide glucosyltransferase
MSERSCCILNAIVIFLSAVIGVCATLVAGSLAYCLLVIVAVRNYLQCGVRRKLKDLPPMSILVPLAGAERSLEDNLRSSFQQNYPQFEIVLGVRHENDPAIAIAEKVMAEFPSVPSRLIATGEPSCANAKVYSLAQMTKAARFDLLVMNDSDIRVPADMLATIAAEFEDPAVGLATCPYCAIPGQRWSSRLESLGMNTQFMAGVLAARLLEGMRFALGPSAVVRRSALASIGGWSAVDSYLAEDFLLGKLVFEVGDKVILSSCRVEHHIGDWGPAENLSHRLRWVRSTRRSRPRAYIGELFKNPLPLALFLVFLDAHMWPWLAAAAGLRLLSAWAVADLALGDPAFRKSFWAIPIEDLLGFGVWVAGFFGNRVIWRGRTYQLHRDGRFEVVP